MACAWHQCPSSEHAHLINDLDLKEVTFQGNITEMRLKLFTQLFIKTFWYHMSRDPVQGPDPKVGSAAYYHPPDGQVFC